MNTPINGSPIGRTSFHDEDSPSRRALRAANEFASLPAVERTRLKKVIVAAAHNVTTFDLTKALTAIEHSTTEELAEAAEGRISVFSLYQRIRRRATEHLEKPAKIRKGAPKPANLQRERALNLIVTMIDVLDHFADEPLPETPGTRVTWLDQLDDAVARLRRHRRTLEDTLNASSE